MQHVIQSWLVKKHLWVSYNLKKIFLGIFMLFVNNESSKDIICSFEDNIQSSQATKFQNRWHVQGT